MKYDNGVEDRMMELINKKNIPSDRSHNDIDHDYSYYCKLFSDMITRTPCLLRRRELNGKSEFSCMGCSKDMIMNSRRSRLNALQERM